MTLLDKYIPSSSFTERHKLLVNAAPDMVLKAARAFRAESDPFFRKMIGLRELPMRMGRIFLRKQTPPPPPFSLDDFSLLEQDSSELVYGLVGRLWRPDFGLIQVPDGAAYCAFKEPGVPKLAFNFSVAKRDDGMTELATETRVFCPDHGTRLKFAPYWYLIRPISGLIRERALASIRASSENPSHLTLSSA